MNIDELKTTKGVADNDLKTSYVGNITKRQHYVWRNYLRPWSTSNDSISYLVIDENKIIKGNLMNVAQQNFFYKLNELTSEQIDFIQQYNSSLPVVLQGLAANILHCYEGYSRLSKECRGQSSPISELPNAETVLRDIEINTFEKLHGTIESLGDELVKCNSAAALEEIVNNNGKFFSAMAFLCVQYTRTNVIRERFKDSMKDRMFVASLVDKSWPLLSLISGFYMCLGLIRNNPSFVFVENTSSISFITGDQPIINTLGDDVDEDGCAKQLELFYPLSPNTAIIVYFTNDASHSVRSIYANEEFVKKCNSLIAKNSKKFLFAKMEEELEPFLQ